MFPSVKGFKNVINLLIQKGNTLGSVQRLRRVVDITTRPFICI